MVLNSWLVLHRMIRSAALMNCQWARNHQVFYPHICAPQEIASKHLKHHKTWLACNLTVSSWWSNYQDWPQPPTQWVSEWVQEVSWDLKEFMASHDNEPLKENMRKETKRSFEIWIDLNYSLVTFLLFRMRVDDHVTFITRGRYIYCTLPLLSWWWWSQDMIILMIIWWRPFLHHDYHWKDLSQKYFYCFGSNQHNDEPPGIPLMDSEDKELKWSDDEIIVTIL